MAIKLPNSTTPNNNLLNKEAEDVTVGFGLLDQAGAEVVGTGPGAEIANVLGVEADGLAADLVELVLAEDDLGPVDGGGEDAELGHLAHPHVPLAHVLRPGDGCRRSVLGDDEVRACSRERTQRTNV